MKRSFRNKYGFLILSAIIALVSVLYIYLGGGWAWETPLARSFPAVGIQVDVDTSTIALELAEDADEMSFAIAPSEGAVREFWAGAQALPAAAGMVACEGAKQELNGLKCDTRGRTLNIAISKAGVRRTLWVVPFKQTSFRTVHSVTSLRWKSLEVVQAKSDNTRIDTKIVVDASTCPHPGDKEAREKCLFAEDFFGRPQLSQAGDPERLVSSVAKWSAHRIVPMLVTAMVIVDALLAGVVIVLLSLWARGRGIGQPPQDGQPIDAHMLLRGYRTVFSWLETLGPSIAISATVLGLILAFDPVVFADRDGSAFGEAIRMAMGASFCGLVMRVLAVTANYALAHLTSWNASEDGLIYPVDGPTPVSSTTPLDKEVDDDEPPQRQARRALRKV